MDLTATPARGDDDETVSSLFARILSREGHTVVGTEVERG